ncbi:MAG TPA: HD domain-containing protein [Phycisphaerae bacterium]|nr:HD domain-containing protein [Phycisphaerae bacterium]
MADERRTINQMAPGEAVDQVFLVRDKDLRTTKKGDLYVVCTLCDRTGSVSARMWQATDAIFQGIPVGGFARVKGRTEDYRGTLQFIIEGLRPVPAEKVEMADFIATTDRDVDKMWAALMEFLRPVHNEPLKQLLRKFVQDKDLVAAVKRAPAAMEMHHPFVGGLVEHTFNVSRAAEALLPLYPQLNADLVRAGVFLHDLGKAAELTADTGINYTDRGQLVGHITIAAIWIQQKADAVAAETGEPFPQRTLDLLQHIILSHHGIFEYGSPKLPAIPEAFFIHYLDNLDAKMWMTTNAVANSPDPDSNFTTYMRQLETRVYRHSASLEAQEGEGAGPLFG